MLDFGDNRSALVIVPHEDDEINLMGGLLPLLVEKGIKVYVCYVTNGDFEFSGRLRIQEAISALGCLGVECENVFFLGYPDASNKVDKSLYGAEKSVTSKYSSFTYGSELKQDFRMMVSGIHSPYTYDSLKKDLKDVILFLKPDVIFCSDMDPHHDHKLTSLAFEESMEEILCLRKEYSPLIFKGFAYSTSYDSVNDFFKGINILPTQKPHNEGNLDNPYFSWDKRIRFPISENVLVNDKEKNILIKAMCKHKSQFFAKRIGSVINSDVVFWPLLIKDRKIRNYTVDKNSDIDGEVKYSILNNNGNVEPISKNIVIVKLLLAGGFAYNNYFINDEIIIPCSIYSIYFEKELNIYTSDDTVYIVDGNLSIPKQVSEVTIVLKDVKGNVYDSCKIIRMSKIERILFEIEKRLFQLSCYIEYKKEKRYRKKLLGNSLLSIGVLSLW